MSSSSDASKPWIESPLWDGFWILNGIWLMAVVFFLYPYKLGGPFSWFMTDHGRALFSSAHLLAPIISVYGLYEFREAMRKEKFRFLWLPLLLLVIPAAVVFVEALTGWASHASFPLYSPVKFLAVLFLAWNYWHFASHNFGVLSLYRVRVKQFSPIDRRVDRWFTSLTMLAMVPLLWYGNAMTRPGRMIFDFLPAATVIREWREPIMLISALLTLCALFFEWRKSNRSWPKMVYIFVIGAQTFVVAFSYPIFYFLLINLNHWISELGIIGKIHANRSSKKHPQIRFILFILLFIAIGLVFDRSFFGDGMWRFGTSLNLDSKAYYLKDIDYASALLMGFVFGLHFLHMLCDRYLFSFRRPEARHVVDSIANKTLYSPAVK